MYHYTTCGLPDVWLRNGFEERETAYGKAVAIHDLEGLHRAIGLHLVDRTPSLSGAEVRFLRKELDLSQGSLAKILGVGETTVRGWEKNRPPISPPAELLLRALYREHVVGDNHIRELADRIAELSRDMHRQRLELEAFAQGWAEAA